MKNGIALSVLIFLILGSLVWLDNETSKNTNRVTEGTQTEDGLTQNGSNMNQSSFDAYVEKLEKLPINEFALSSFGGCEIVSTDVTYDDFTETFLNEIVIDAGISENFLFKVKLYAVYQLALNEEKNEWGSPETEPFCLEMRNEVISESISGEYNIFEVESYDIKEDYLINAKISPYEIPEERDSKGWLSFEVNDIPAIDSANISVSGYFQDFILNEANYLLCDYPTEINWGMQSGDYLFTNKENTEYTLKLMYKESTEEILLLKIYNEDDFWEMHNEIYVYKLRKLDNE